MNIQKIALFTTSGEVGRRLTAEALERGHSVTVIVGNDKEFKLKHPNLEIKKGNAKKKNDISKYAGGHDVVICIDEPTTKNPEEHIEITRNIIEGAKKTGVQHVVVAAHSFDLDNTKIKQSENILKPLMKAQKEALKLLQNEKAINWGYMHLVESDSKKKNGNDQYIEEVLFSQPYGENRISKEDCVAALLDEAEKGQALMEEFNERED